MLTKKPKKVAPSKGTACCDDGEPRKLFIDCPWNELVSKIGWSEADCLLILLECLTFVPGDLSDMMCIEDRWDLIRARAIRMAGFVGYEEDWMTFKEWEELANRDPRNDLH
ncbi:MAG: hypothetical protein GC131_04460 [Alphaproteobacteria bacterium]|nr:hypothetical protein [Alphaproteobacteria bacterium]